MTLVSGGGFLKDKWLTSVSDQNKIGVVSKVFANFSLTFAQTGIAASQTLIVFFGVFLIVFDSSGLVFFLCPRAACM